MGSGTWTFAGASLSKLRTRRLENRFCSRHGNPDPFGAVALGDVVHSGAGRLQLISNVKCRSFAQTAAFSISRMSVSSEGDISSPTGPTLR